MTGLSVLFLSPVEGEVIALPLPWWERIKEREESF
jgi:hypothetical protein